MNKLSFKLLTLLATLILSKTLFGSLYEEQCNKTSSLSRVGAVCSDGFASVTYATAQLTGWEDGDIDRSNLDRDKFEANLKSEKLRLLSDNYNELLRYFWQEESIKIKEFECKDKSITNEGLFTDIGYSRKYKLRTREEQRATFERRRALAEELIVYQRALNEIEAEESKITRNDASYDYVDNVDPKSGVPSRTLTFEARENLERLKLARFTILNSYPILDTDAWREKSKRDIFLKPSDEEATVDDINFVISHVFDKSLSEIQDNIIEEAQATCNQSTSDLVANDFIAAPVIAESGLFTEIYCREYDKVKGKDILKNTGLVALSVVAIAAAPLTGSSSAMVAYSALAAGGVSAGTDIYLAYRDIDNYYDLKRAFLTDISTEGQNTLATIEEVRSAQTQAILSTIFAGAGGVGEGIGIYRFGKAKRGIKPPHIDNISRPKELVIQPISQSDAQRIADIRKNTLYRGMPMGTKRNIAFVDFDIADMKGTMVERSGQFRLPASMSGHSADISKSPIFKTSTVDVRNFDSEAKLLETLASQMTDKKVTGVIKIVSERPICPSCQGVIRQFMEMFPNIRVEVFEGVL